MRKLLSVRCGSSRKRALLFSQNITKNDWCDAYIETKPGQYIKSCVFGFSKNSTVTATLLPSFDTVLHNVKLGFYTRLSCCTGAVVDALRLIN